jgi:voltage-gated potassium channel
MPTPLPGPDARRTRWESRTEPWLIAGAVIFLGAYAWPILDQDLDSALESACTVATVAIWAMFAVDFVVRLVLAGILGGSSCGTGST